MNVQWKNHVSSLIPGIMVRKAYASHITKVILFASREKDRKDQSHSHLSCTDLTLCRAVRWQICCDEHASPHAPSSAPSSWNLLLQPTWNLLEPQCSGHPHWPGHKPRFPFLHSSTTTTPMSFRTCELRGISLERLTWPPRPKSEVIDGLFPQIKISQQSGCSLWQFF